MTVFGPRRYIGELSSSYYWRWARYCMSWVPGLALLLIVAIVVLRQSLEGSWQWAPMIFLLLLGGSGIGMATLAALGYLNSAGLARLGEAGPPPGANNYRRFIVSMVLLLLAWTCLQSWIDLALLTNLPHESTEHLLPPPFSLLEEHPLLCLLCATLWLLSSTLILLHLARHERHTYERALHGEAALTQMPLIHQAIADHEQSRLSPDHSNSSDPSLTPSNRNVDR